MPFYACPNCGSSVSSAAAATPPVCPGCCALLHPFDDVPPPAASDAPPARRPKPVLRMPLGSDDGAPSAARHALRDLRPELGDARLRTCELLVSELVTNVVLHTPAARSLAAADLRVRLYGDRVRVEVRDDGPGFKPRPRTPDQDPGSGWGLHLVRELADEWGIEPGLQNCVWFEVGRTPLASGLHAAAHH
jgi:anti-sigma regulatory factor (Ser/Thr protein kinase)